MFTADNDARGHGCAPVLPSGEWNQSSGCDTTFGVFLYRCLSVFYADLNVDSKYICSLG